MKNVRNLRIVFAARFDKLLRKTPSDIIQVFDETIELFKENPRDKSLRRHLLKGKYATYESINITDDYRALFKEKKSSKLTLITFHFIGTHEQLYGE